MTIRYKFWALVLAFCSLAAPALADDQEGAYVYVSGGQAFAFGGCGSLAIPAGASCSNRTPAFRAGFGYQYTPTWGLEVSYGQFGGAYTSGFANFGGAVGAGSYSWQMKATGLAVQAVTTVHMSDTFGVYAKFGVARVEYMESLDVSSASGFWVLANPSVMSKNSPALAAGFRYDVTPHGTIMLGAEYYGQADVYNVGQKVRLVTVPSVSLMWKY